MKHCLRLLVPYLLLVASTTGFAKPSFIRTYPTPDEPNLACASPTGLSESVSPTSAALFWNSVSGVQYTVQYRQQGSGTWIDRTVQFPGFLSVSGLTVGTGYDWQVVGTCPDASTAVSGVRSFTAQCTVPSGPGTTAIAATGASVSWGGSGGNSFTVRWRAVGTTNWTSGTTTSNFYNISGLTGNTTYEWQVQKTCQEVGVTTGFTASVTFTTACNIPNTLMLIASGPTGAQLQWQSVAGDTRYDLIWKAVGTPTSTTVTSLSAASSWLVYSLTGLTPNTAYNWQVQTVCGDGSRSALSSVQSFTTTACQGPTSLMEQSISASSASVWWSSNSSPAYTAQVRQQGAASWIDFVVTINTASLTGLLPSTAYEWRVSNTCGGGQVGTSSIRSFTTTACPAVTNLSETLSPTNSIQLNWTRPSGALVQAQYRQQGAATWIDATISGQFSGVSFGPLLPGTVYEWRVVTACSASASAVSGVRSFTTNNYCPAPTSLNTSGISLSSAFVVWNSTLAGPTSSTYTVQVRPVSTTLWTSYNPTTNLSYSLTGLTPATAYEWQVVRNCTASLSVVSGISSFTTASCEATGLAERLIEPTAASFMWNNNSSQITYTFQYRRQTDANWISRSVPYLAHDVSALTPNTGYEWRVVSSCPNNLTAVTAPRSFTTQCTTPNIQYIYVNTVTTTAAQIGWSALSGQVMYMARWRQVGTTNWSTNTTTANTTSSISLTGLTNATTYEFQVQAVCNGQGTGYSLSKTFTTTCGSAYSTWVQTVRSKSAEVSFNLVPPGTLFDIFWRVVGSPTTFSVTTPPSTSEGSQFIYKLEGLAPNTAYQWQVRTRCDANTVSALTQWQSFTTTSLADLAISMAVSKRTPKVNDLISYTITLTNQGTATCNNVTITSYLPSNMAFVSSTPGSPVRWYSSFVFADIASIQAGQSIPVSFQVRVFQSGTFVNAAEITSMGADNVSSTPANGWANGEQDEAQVDIRTADGAGPTYYPSNPNQRVLPPVQDNQPTPDPNTADLSLGLSSSTRTPQPNETLTVRVRIQNRGGATASGVTAKLVLPAGWQLLEAGWAATGQPNEYVNQTSLTLASGSSQTLNVAVRAAGNGPQTISAQIASANPTDSDSSPNNGYTNGEDDTATIDIRMQ